MWEAIFFYGLAGVALVSAILMVLMKNPVVSAMYLIVTFFCTAGFYVMLDAQLLAVLQIVVYAGAIMVLFLFVIMLLNLNRTSFSSYKLFFTKAIALLVILFILFAVGGSLGHMIVQQGSPLTEGAFHIDPAEGDHVQNLGAVLFSRYIYPFEIMAVMLLAGIIGAVLLTKKRT